MTALDPHQQALVDALAGATFQQYGRALLKIEDEDGELVAFELNEAQEIVYREIKRLQADGKGVKLLILKGRQQRSGNVHAMPNVAGSSHVHPGGCALPDCWSLVGRSR